MVRTIWFIGVFSPVDVSKELVSLNGMGLDDRSIVHSDKPAMLPSILDCKLPMIPTSPRFRVPLNASSDHTVNPSNVPDFPVGMSKRVWTTQLKFPVVHPAGVRTSLLLPVHPCPVLGLMKSVV